MEQQFLLAGLACIALGYTWGMLKHFTDSIDAFVEGPIQGIAYVILTPLWWCRIITQDFDEYRFAFGLGIIGMLFLAVWTFLVNGMEYL